MPADEPEQGLTSRYTIKKPLGTYPPWQGFSVTDSLSGKNYLLFSITAPAGTSISLDDLKMRDYLFSSQGGAISPTLSLQNSNGQITFLLPHGDLVPVTKAIPSMKPAQTQGLLETLVSNVLLRMSSGLFFNNLTPQSIVMILRSLVILPTAYILPGALLRTLSDTSTEEEGTTEPLFGDLGSLGEILAIFSRYMPPDVSTTCNELSSKLLAFGPRTDSDDLYNCLNELCSLCGIETDCAGLVTSRDIPYRTPTLTLKNMRSTAFKAREGEKHIVILKGKQGEGKTRFLRVVADKLVHEWGYREGSILSDQSVLNNITEKSHPANMDFIIIDNHAHDSLLNCFVIERLLREKEQYKLAIVATTEKTTGHFINALKTEGQKRSISIKEINLPASGETDKLQILSQLLPSKLSKPALRHVDPKQPFALLQYEITVPPLPGVQKKRDGSKAGVLDNLSPDERSVLNFLAVFNFEVPLSFLQNIYSTENSSLYVSLQRLCSMRLVNSRAEKSNLANGELCLVYGLSSRSLAGNVLNSVTASRRRQIHKNIALILKEQKNAPCLYIFYHLAQGGEKEEASLKGYELFKILLQRKAASAVDCFNESYLKEKLDRCLPAEQRFMLMLSLGNFFSLTGSMGKAERLYRCCREETSRIEAGQAFRTLAVEAVRRECEILEKKGEFLKAEKLLQKAMETHGEHLPSNERAKLYNDSAWVHYRLGQFDRSWENCLLVHKLLDEKQNPLEIAQSYNLMGAINWNRSKYDEAIMCHKRCLALREEAKDEISVAASCNNLGLVYRSMGKVKDALECFKKSMEIKQRHSNLPGMAAAHLNIALAYLDMDNVKEAEKNCLIANRLAEDIGNQQLLAEACGTLGEICFLKGTYNQARNYYFQDLHLCHKTSSLREKAVVFRRLAELSLAEGKIAESNELLNQARELNQKIGSRLETALLNLLEGRILLGERNREEGRRKLEGASLELSLLGRKIMAAAVTAEIGELYIEEGNEQLARECLLRATALSSDVENVPSQIKNLQVSLDKKSPLVVDNMRTDQERFNALCRISSMMRMIRDPETLHANITETARRITGMERAALIMQTNGKERYRIMSAEGGFETGSTLTDKNILALFQLAGQLGFPLDTTRTSIPGGKVGDDFLREHPSIICIPLWIKDEVAGFLYLDSSKGPVTTSDEDHSFLVAFSQQVTASLERMLLSERVKSFETVKPVMRPVPTRQKDRFSFQDIIGNSQVMKHIFELINGIKDMDTSVLLTGENGTGKDLIAKTIHYCGSRREKPFVSLNCSAFPGELLESQLFGHEKGAFTGAHRQSIGHFESANGGTIFLNEIGDMPLRLQPKLLRILEEQKFYRVGGTREISTNVKIITATNKDLLQCIKQGTFREDLYYRINVFPIRIPALRERREDIEPLCNHFLTTYCSLYNIPKKRISLEAMMCLINFDWPGNVRELENTINRIIILSKKETILPEDLPENIVKHSEVFQSKTQASLEESIEHLLENMQFSASDPILPKVQGMLIRKTVEKMGDKTKAAAILGISKPTLYSKLKNNETNL